jgi:hypothetical protein
MISLSYFRNRITARPAERSPNGVVVGNTVMPAPKMALNGSVSYTDRSNCRRAMMKHAAEAGQTPEDYEVFSTMEGYRYRPKTAPVAAQPKAKAVAR